MTVAAQQRLQLRQEITPIILEYLNTRSSARFRAHPRRLKAAAKQIAMNVSAIKRRIDLRREAQTVTV